MKLTARHKWILDEVDMGAILASPPYTDTATFPRNYSGVPSKDSVVAATTMRVFLREGYLEASAPNTEYRSYTATDKARQALGTLSDD